MRDDIKTVVQNIDELDCDEILEYDEVQTFYILVYIMRKL